MKRNTSTKARRETERRCEKSTAFTPDVGTLTGIPAAQARTRQAIEDGASTDWVRECTRRTTEKVVGALEGGKLTPQAGADEMITAMEIQEDAKLDFLYPPATVAAARLMHKDCTGRSPEEMEETRKRTKKVHGHLDTKVTNGQATKADVWHLGLFLAQKALEVAESNPAKAIECCRAGMALTYRCHPPTHYLLLQILVAILEHCGDRWLTAALCKYLGEFNSRTTGPDAYIFSAALWR